MLEKYFIRSNNERYTPAQKAIECSKELLFDKIKHWEQDQEKNTED